MKGSSREKSGTNFGAFGTGFWAGFCTGFCTFGGGGAAVTDGDGCAEGTGSGGGGISAAITVTVALTVALALAVGCAVAAAAGSIALTFPGRLARTVSTTAVPAIVSSIPISGATTYDHRRVVDAPACVVLAP